MSETSYIEHVVQRVNAVTAHCGPILLYGENINYGSCIGGLARGLTVNASGTIRNVGNCELTHIGVGLGMMLDGGQAALFGKQLDFLLLGLDQMCNTFNFIRAYRPRDTWGSFTILVIICDQGYQGPQSSLNNAGDFSSLANIPVYCLNGVTDTTRVIERHFASPGFRIICASQRLFGAPALDAPTEWSSDDSSVFRYRSGNHATVVGSNFTLRDTLAIDDALDAYGLRSDVFHVNFVPGADLQSIVESCRRTKRLVLVDDSKTITKFGDMLLSNLAEAGVSVEVLSHARRGCLDAEYGAGNDEFAVDVERAVSFVRRG